ncbi:hypothetical protein [Paenibacillus sp.]|uniref:hypothetical protein n=1 Tax=Paenibacillus sp. TaxID=58172 RepID=UPI002811BD95|nr:hypothetical protein [Paenibacillus sp.]
MAVYYVCPTCQAKNEEQRSYCDKCGHWLLSTAYPAKRIDTKKRAKKAFGGGSIIALLFIGAVFYFGFVEQGATPTFSPGTYSFEKMEIGEQYTISQFVVDPKRPSATADLTAVNESRDPIEVKAVFYDEADNRVGVASTIITNAIAKGQTTTISLDFEEATGLDKLRQVRIEVNPLSPLMLLDRMGDKLNNVNPQ